MLVIDLIEVLQSFSPIARVEVEITKVSDEHGDDGVLAYTPLSATYEHGVVTIHLNEDEPV